jgi:hypothetical protein
MPKAILVALNEPADPAHDADYHRWYDDVHIPDITALPGFVSATRYRVSKTQMGGATPDAPAYLAIYEIDTDDLDATIKGIGAGVREGTVRQGSPPQASNSSLIVYEELPPGTGS